MREAVMPEMLRPPRVNAMTAALWHIGLARPRARPEVDLSPSALFGYFHSFPARPEAAFEDFDLDPRIILPDHIDPTGERHLILPEVL